MGYCEPLAALDRRFGLAAGLAGSIGLAARGADCSMLAAIVLAAGCGFGGYHTRLRPQQQHCSSTRCLIVQLPNCSALPTVIANQLWHV